MLAIAVSSIVAGIAITGVFLSKLSLFYSVAGNSKPIDLNATSMVGNFIGGVVGAVWSFAGVLLFFLALRLQSKELSLQIKELQDTREVFLVQQFENTFFNLLKTQQDIKAGIVYENKETEFEYKSHQFFDYLEHQMKAKNTNLLSYYKQLNAYNASEQLTPEQQSNKQSILSSLKFEQIPDFTLLGKEHYRAKLIYKQTFESYHHQLGHYFRNLYHILNYLWEAERRELIHFNHQKMAWEISENKDVIYSEELGIKRKYKRYAEFMQAQMSTSELFVLFYNGLFFPKMKELLHRYNFLENLSKDDLLSPLDVNFYSEYHSDNISKLPAIKFKSRQEIMQLG